MNHSPSSVAAWHMFDQSKGMWRYDCGCIYFIGPVGSEIKIKELCHILDLSVAFYIAAVVVNCAWCPWYRRKAASGALLSSQSIMESVLFAGIRGAPTFCQWSGKSSFRRSASARRGPVNTISANQLLC